MVKFWREPKQSVINILVISDAADFSARLAASARKDQFNIVAQSWRLQKAPAPQGSAPADAVVWDIRSATDLERAEAIMRAEAIVTALRASELAPLVIVSPVFSGAELRKLIAMRAADWLDSSSSADSILAACARAVSRAREHGTHLKAAQQCCVGFVPIKGGAGATTLAIETAYMLAKRESGSPRAACLVNVDFTYGVCADYLSIEPGLQVLEVAAKPERIDADLVEAMVSRHSTGFAVLEGHIPPGQQMNLPAEVVQRLLDTVASRFAGLVLDIPRAWTPWLSNVVKGLDRLCLVSDASVVGVLAAKRAIEYFRPMCEAETQLHVVINKHRGGLLSDQPTAKAMMGLFPDHKATVLPWDPSLMERAALLGNPLGALKKKNAFSSAVLELAGTLISPRGAGR